MFTLIVNSLLQKLSQHKFSRKWTITIHSTIPNLKKTLGQLIVRYGKNCIVEKVDVSTTIIEFYSRNEDKFDLLYAKLKELCDVLGVEIDVEESKFWRKIPKELRARGVLGLQRQTRDDVRRGVMSSGTIELVIDAKFGKISSPSSQKEKAISRTQGFEISSSPKYSQQYTETIAPTTPTAPRHLRNIHWMAIPSAYGTEKVLESASVQNLRDFIKTIKEDLVVEIEEYRRRNAQNTRRIPNARSMFMIKCITYQDVVDKQVVSVKKLEDLIGYSEYHSKSPLRIEWHKEKPTIAEFLYLSCE